MASTLGGHTQSNIDLLKVFNFFQETMRTLSNYKEQLQTHLGINLTHQEMKIFKRINLLSTRINWFSFYTYQLLPHFKDENYVTINRPNEQAPFNIKNFKKMDSKETHHTLSTHLGLVENDVNALTKQPTKNKI